MEGWESKGCGGGHQGGGVRAPFDDGSGGLYSVDAEPIPYVEEILLCQILRRQEAF